jgi:hypothetical protein
MSQARSAMAFLGPSRSRAIASVLALALICVPLTLAALWAFPIWDDAWIWLLLNEHGTGAITTTWVDRPVMGTVWSLLATTEPAFWRSALVAQAVLWPTLGIFSGILWSMLFPRLRQYAVVVACMTLAPIVCRVQMVTATIALAHLLSVVPSYGAFLLLLRFVRGGGRFGWAALGLSLPLLGFGILVMEYALPVVIVIVTFLLWYAWRASDPATRARAWCAILCSALTAGAAYATFLLMADFSPRRGTVSPMYVLTLGEAHLVRFPFKFAEGIWMSIAGGIVNAMGGVTLASRSGVVAAAYGALVTGLLFYGCRNPPHVATSAATDAIGTRPVLPLGAAFVAGILPTVAMGRIPWNAADGMSSRFELPLLPVTVALVVLISLSLVRPRFWAVPILLFGFIAGNATFTEVWSAIRERQEMSALGGALQPYVASKDGYTVAAVVLPERSLGPRRDYEVTARLAATWPPELRRRFWAFRFGGVRPFARDEYEAEAVFGSRGDCTPPREIKKDVRHVTREGPLDQLLWVSRTSDRSISIEPYCLEGRNEQQLLPQPGSPKFERP